MNKIKLFTLLTICLPLSIFGNSFIKKSTVESRIFSMSLESAFIQIDNQIQLISVDEKKVFVLISTNGIVDQSHYSNSQEVNAHFLNTEGIVECSYAWNNNMMKLVLDKTKAKEILTNTFGFSPDIISNLF